MNYHALTIIKTRKDTLRVRTRSAEIRFFGITRACLKQLWSFWKLWIVLPIAFRQRLGPCPFSCSIPTSALDRVPLTNWPFKLTEHFWKSQVHRVCHKAGWSQLQERTPIWFAYFMYLINLIPVQLYFTQLPRLFPGLCRTNLLLLPEQRWFRSRVDGTRSWASRGPEPDRNYTKQAVNIINQPFNWPCPQMIKIRISKSYVWRCPPLISILDIHSDQLNNHPAACFDVKSHQCCDPWVQVITGPGPLLKISYGVGRPLEVSWIIGCRGWTCSFFGCQRCQVVLNCFQ